MMESMDMLLLTLKTKGENWLDRMLHEEKGASDIVAIMVVIVILLAVAGIFRTQLEELVRTVFGKATDWVNEN